MPQELENHPKRLRLVLGIVLILAALVSFVLGGWVVDWKEVLAWIQGRHLRLMAFVEANLLIAAGLYFWIYVVFTGLSLPGALFLTLVGGGFFGLGLGVALVSFASTLGASVAFLASRYLLRDQVMDRYGARLAAVDRELERQGWYYLLAVRLNPVIPYFLINLLFGLTRMPLWLFWIVSQVGMLPATIIYTNAGQQLTEIHSLADVVRWPIVLSLLVLSLFPLAARAAAALIQRPGGQTAPSDHPGSSTRG